MLSDALNQLAGLSVPNITNMGMDELPNRLQRAQLPALLVLPMLDRDRRLFSDGDSHYTSSPFLNGTPTLTVRITHLLLVAPADSGYGTPSYNASLIGHVDATLTALKANPTLNGTLAQPLRVTLDMGVQPYNDDSFVGCAFRHEWVLAVTS